MVDIDYLDGGLFGLWIIWLVDSLNGGLFEWWIIWMVDCATISTSLKM